MLSGKGFEVPAEIAQLNEFCWYHVPSKGALVVVFLGEEPRWYLGHYSGGRMWPCTGEECGLCGQGIGHQVRYCFQVAEYSTHRSGILELSQSVAQLVKSHADERGRLHGLMCEFRKEAQSRHSRNVVELIRETAPAWADHVTAPNLIRAMVLTWKKLGAPIPKNLQKELLMAEDHPVSEEVTRFKRPSAGGRVVG